MRHAILGAGAIGGLVGTAVASLGQEVAVLVRAASLCDYPASLVLQRPTGALAAPAKAVGILAELVDILWISTKTYQLQEALDTIEASPRLVVPLLNGLDHVAALRKKFGEERVIPATIAVEAEKTAPGRFIQRSPFVRLNLGATGEPALGSLISQLRGIGFTCQFISNESTLLWSKLCFLGPFALVTSASGLSIGEVIADPGWSERLHSAVVEACMVANRSGAEIDIAQIQEAFVSAPSTMRSSMQKDLAAGRKLELDAIGGPIVRGGKRYGIGVKTTSNLISDIAKRTAASG